MESCKSAYEASRALIEELEKSYDENRSELVGEDGSISTPLSVLREVARNYGTPIHSEVIVLQLSESQTRYRIEMFVGRMKGLGEASRKKLAMHIASVDLLTKVRRNGFEVPSYGLMPGCRITPSIFSYLREFCVEFNLLSPIYVEMPTDPDEVNPPLFSYKCQIGRLFKIGYSDSKCLAKRWAAKKIYEALTGTILPMDEVAYGPHCSLLEKLNINPIPSNKKLSIMKMRQDSRTASSIGTLPEFDDDKLEKEAKNGRKDEKNVENDDDFEDEYEDALDAHYSNPQLTIDSYEQIQFVRGSEGMQDVKDRLSHLRI